MKKLILTAAAMMMAVAAYGQGKFIFNTHDTLGGNVLTFTDSTGAKIAGADYFVQVLAGADANSLAVVSGANTGANGLPINRLASGAPTGFTNPFSDTYTVPGLGGGKNATVGYRAYQGTSWDAATVKSSLVVVPTQVALVEDPTPANLVTLGTSTVVLAVPEPTTWALGLLGLGTLLAIRRRK